MIYCNNKNCDINVCCKRYKETPQRYITTYRPYVQIDLNSDEVSFTCEMLVIDPRIVVKQSKMNSDAREKSETE